MNSILFCNVDLEIESDGPLNRLVDELGEDVIVLHCGESRLGKRYGAYLELGDGPCDAASIIDHFCMLIDALDESGRREWDDALRRVFNLGYESGNDGRMHESIITQETVRRAADIGAGITVTIYPLRDGA